MMKVMMMVGSEEPVVLHSHLIILSAEALCACPCVCFGFFFIQNINVCASSAARARASCRAVDKSGSRHGPEGDCSC